MKIEVFVSRRNIKCIQVLLLGGKYLYLVEFRE